MGLHRDPKFQAILPPVLFSRFQEPKGIVKDKLVAQSLDCSKEALSRMGTEFRPRSCTLFLMFLFFLPGARDDAGRSQVRFLFQRLHLLTEELTGMPGINIVIDVSINIETHTQ